MKVSPLQWTKKIISKFQVFEVQTVYHLKPREDNYDSDLFEDLSSSSSDLSEVPKRLL